MDLSGKFRKALRHPGEVLPYLGRVVGRFLHIRKVTRDGLEYFEYKGVLYPSHLANHAAAPYIYDVAREFCTGRGIDVGAGSAGYPGAEPVQNERDQNAYCLDRFAEGSLDYVFSSHCLEHLARWQEALRLWVSKLRVGGVLFLYLPHESMMLWRPGGLWAGNDHKWVPRVEVLVDFLAGEGLEVVERNDDKDEYWSFHLAVRKVGG